MGFKRARNKKKAVQADKDEMAKAEKATVTKNSVKKIAIKRQETKQYTLSHDFQVSIGWRKERSAGTPPN